ncbi:hypothetical protein H1C71_001619 [Ictidomys tridecemlineatus]|nr:hypothetical protein H1C71_001619 [Ictidomys tridecemlineatus]
MPSRAGLLELWSQSLRHLLSRVLLLSDSWFGMSCVLIQLESQVDAGLQNAVLNTRKVHHKVAGTGNLLKCGLTAESHLVLQRSFFDASSAQDGGPAATRSRLVKQTPPSTLVLCPHGVNSLRNS